MDITQILGPIDAVEAMVTGTAKVERDDAVCVQLPTRYLYRSGVFRPVYGLDIRGLVGSRIIVHLGRVRVGDDGNSEEQIRIIKAYSLTGKIIGDHVPPGQGYDIINLISLE